MLPLTAPAGFATPSMANLVLAFEPTRVISRKPGYVAPETGKLEFGGVTT